MVSLRIVAYPIDERDWRTINSYCTNLRVDNNIVIADVEESRLPEIQAAGVVLQRIEGGGSHREGEAQVGLTDTPPRALAEDGLFFRAGRFADVQNLQPPDDNDIFIATFDGPLLASQIEILHLNSVELLEKIGRHAYSVAIPPAKAGDVSRLNFVGSLRPFTASDTLDSDNLATFGDPEFDWSMPIEHEALLHRAADLTTLIKWFNLREVAIVGYGHSKVRFLSHRGARLILELANLSIVKAVDIVVPPTLTNDHARHLVGVDDLPLDKGGWSLSGSGQIVGVADSGIDDEHPDLRGRFVKIIARARRNDSSDSYGHGTHVVGSIVGDGTASLGEIRGIAPAAAIVFQSIMDSDGGLSGLPVDLYELLEEAYLHGARIHNNSWSAEAQAVYRFSSLEVDRFVADHPDMVVVIAAGNTGSAHNSIYTNAGCVDLFSIGAPATAKNVIAVGASRSSRVIDPSPTWSDWWPTRFPDPPISDDHLSGDAESIAGFSARGPCNDHLRFKPDLVAPGTFILSTRASTARAESFWREFDNNSYAFMGGTSMSAPIVSGCAALVREWLSVGGLNPSAALIKAFLINSARWLRGLDALACSRNPPNNHQGFGMVNLSGLHKNCEAVLETFTYDSWQMGSTASLPSLGSTAIFDVETNDGSLHVCLTWTDPPGRGIQHALGLIVENQHTGERWTGNDTRYGGVTTLDTGNNVQIVRVSYRAASSYIVRVIAASELLYGQQDFALVISGSMVRECSRR